MQLAIIYYDVFIPSFTLLSFYSPMRMHLPSPLSYNLSSPRSLVPLPLGNVSFTFFSFFSFFFRFLFFQFLFSLLREPIQSHVHRNKQKRYSEWRESDRRSKMRMTFPSIVLMNALWFNFSILAHICASWWLFQVLSFLDFELGIFKEKSTGANGWVFTTFWANL